MDFSDIAHWIQRETDELLDYHPFAEGEAAEGAGVSAPAPPLLQWPPGEES